MQLRFTADCALQYSTDGGATWTDVPGCVNYPPGGYPATEHPPPNPQGVSTSQQGCNIAEYLSYTLLKRTIAAAISNIDNTLKIVDFGAAMIAIIPGLGVAGDIAALALGGTYNIIYGGTKGDYQDALADDALWVDVRCAIFGAIRADGHLTPANFAGMVAAVGAVSYTHADVLNQMTGYLNLLGYQGIQALEQLGSLEEGDCTSCGGAEWCYTFDFSKGQCGWTPFTDPDSHYVESQYSPGNGWQSVIPGGATNVFDAIQLHNTGSFHLLQTELLMWSGKGNGVVYNHACENADCTTYVGSHWSILGSGAFTHILTWDTVCDGFEINVIGDSGVMDNEYFLQALTVRGTGACPFGDPNC